MQVISTRDPSQTYSVGVAMQKGLADDGGLFVPEQFPDVDLTTFSKEWSYPEFAANLLQHFFTDDPVLEQQLPQICQRAFNFPVPLKQVDASTYVLELFHGPTNSFKDFGARFLAECLQVLSVGEQTTILVATSGDTGSAVAGAFHDKDNINVVVLFPEGKISQRQEKQITCWQDNITAVAVQGTFDDCQHLVKSAYAHFDTMKLSTANSINIGRLLPQMVYYAYHSWHFQQAHQQTLNVVVPSGNVGNVTACFYAKMLGFPIGDVVLATNSNTVLPDYLATGEFVPRATVETLANAMDVGNPSNLERLQHLFPEFDALRDNIRAIAVNDAQIETTIKQVYADTGMVICPHTATGFYARQQLDDKPWTIVATADPAKFETIVEPLVGKAIPLSAELKTLLNKSNHHLRMQVDLSALQMIIEPLSD